MAPIAIVLPGLLVVAGVWALASSPVGEAVARRIAARADRDLQKRVATGSRGGSGRWRTRSSWRRATSGTSWRATDEQERREAGQRRRGSEHGTRRVPICGRDRSGLRPRRRSRDAGRDPLHPHRFRAGRRPGPILSLRHLDRLRRGRRRRPVRPQRLRLPGGGTRPPARRPVPQRRDGSLHAGARTPPGGGSHLLRERHLGRLRRRRRPGPLRRQPAGRRQPSLPKRGRRGLPSGPRQPGRPRRGAVLQRSLGGHRRRRPPGPPRPERQGRERRPGRLRLPEPRRRRARASPGRPLRRGGPPLRGGGVGGPRPRRGPGSLPARLRVG